MSSGTPGPAASSSLSKWVARARGWLVGLVGLLAVALVVSSYPFVEPAAAAPTPDPVPAPTPATQAGLEPTGAGLVRPDVTSAQVTARSSGQRVEVLSARTEYARTWALPGGGFESEAVGSPVRFADAKAPDGWRDVDTTLVTDPDGTVRPRAVPDQVVLAGRGDAADDLVKSADGGRALTLGAGVDKPLPAPVLDGSTATYPDVLPGVDVKVEVRSTGFEQLWVAKDRAGLDALLSEQAGGDQGVSAAMTADKLTATPQADGCVTFTDSAKKTVSSLAAPVVWDATTTPDGTPAEVAADFDVVDSGDPLPPKTGASGDLELSVVPDQDWLADPARKFPVTIDPTYVTGANQAPMFDTWVKEGLTTDQSNNPNLPAGMGPDGMKHRSFLNFATAPFQGKKVTSASLSLWSDTSGTCTANGWSAYDAGLATTASRWTAQPTVGTKYATSTDTKGFSSSCAAGSVSIDMKAQLQTWADGSATTKGMALKADDETTNVGYHRFWSNEAATKPVLRWTYDRSPAQPPTITIANATMYKPAGSSTAYPYVGKNSIDTAGIVSDPDGDTVRAHRYIFPNATATTGQTSTCYSAYVASGSNVPCTITNAPMDGSVWVRGLTFDKLIWGPMSSTPVEVRVAANTPAAPVVTCPGLTNNSWTTTGPANDVLCTITATGTGYSAPSSIKWSVDNVTWTTSPITQSSSTSVAKITVTLPKTNGGHRITAYAGGPAGVTSPRTAFQVGWGTASLELPMAKPMATTTDTVAVAASGPPRGGSTMPTAKVQWRVSGGTTGWVDAPAGTSFTTVDDTLGVKASANFDTTLLVGQADASAVVVGERTSTLVDLRVCLGYDSGTQCTTSSTIQRVPHALGDGFPQADAGPGQVALWTGELSVDDTDASLSTPDGGLSISRTHSSFAGPPAVQNAVFGPGWNASFEGDDSGAGGAEIWDNTHVDGTLAVADSDGSMLLFKTPGSPGGARRTGTNLTSGQYVPADEDTGEAGAKLTVSGAGTSPVVELASEDGIVTKFQATQAPVANVETPFQTVEVREPATSMKTTYAYDTAGRVTAIIAALPDGVSSCAPGTPVKGCRVLKISYATTTTATASTPGDYKDQVKQITAQVNTDTPDKVLADYKYDSLGRLVAAADTRTGLVTGYTWTGTGTALRLATLTPPGEVAYTFAYAGNKLSKVTRPNPASAGGGTAQLAAYVYGVPLNGTVTGLPDMTTEPTKWMQDRTPTWAAAVFGQDAPITAAPAANSPAWLSADLQFTDDQGYTLNTASYGAGDWQLTAADYDTSGNVIRAWDDRALSGIRDGSLPGGTNASDVATLTVYNDDITSGGTVVTPAGTLVTDVYGPVHPVVAADGTLKPLRTHTATSYDQGAPTSGINPDTSQPYRLPTKTVTTAETSDGALDSKLSTNLTGYDPLQTGDASGWALGQATSTTVDIDQDGTVSSGDITSKTRYDARGRTIETRQPKSDGTDAGTKVTAYYTGASTGASGCTSKPEWSGMTCQVGPAAQPSGQTMPVTKTTSYTWDLQTATEVDTSGAVTSTTTTSYNAQDRPTTATTTVSGLTGSQAVPAVTTSYDAATGDVTGTSSTAGTTATTYDSWGRQLTYTNTPAGQPADSSTTTYDTAGRVTTVVDGNGQTAYTYDGDDAAGKAERRGLVTAVKVKTTGGTEYTSTGAYDDGGDLTLEKLPGNLTRRTAIDNAGDQTALTVNGQGVDPDTGNLIADQPWLGWTTTSNAQSQVVNEYTPDGSALDNAGQSNRTYTYDKAGRLTKVQDRTADTDTLTTVPCQTRTYSFDANGNRTGQDTIPAAGDGSCTTTGGNPTIRAYDTADRPTTGANGTGSYTYDQLGRQTTIPAADAPTSSLGAITLGYYDTDNIRTINQGTLGSGGTQTTYTLDGAARRLSQTTQNDTGTSTLLRHYTDDGDNPTWTVDTRSGTTTTTRYNELIDGNLGLTLTTTGGTTTAQIDLNTPRGDTASTVTLTNTMTGPGAASAAGIDNWNTYTEYGTPQQVAVTTPGGVTGIGYGWLGAKQRAATEAGLTLMGARLYNPITGLFTSTDPQLEGGDTQYGYPNDPVNSTDLDGNSWWRRGWGAVKTGFRATWHHGFVRPARYTARGFRTAWRYGFVGAARTTWHSIPFRFQCCRLEHGGWSAGLKWRSKGQTKFKRVASLDYHKFKQTNGRKVLHYHLKTKKHPASGHRLFRPINGKYYYSG